ncbi:amino acid adenylation domain-containing protein [Vibrio sp. Of7-15]|uniref:non-ribosomal peptide synthetase n=1 Tax=Vibrio sp. Of7-15 TaxID=2724879 RepID=UPI001EF2B2B9|nr:non-ribosomal peptide synthetase [Vibrio sp. Of7-15]MCG7497837.1 amino acid adenylation domain-containing protein [Vibrio sp. Of7-15]
MATQIKNKLDNLSPEKRALVEKLLAKKKQQKQAKHRDSQIAIPDKKRTESALSFAQQRLWLLDQLEGGSSHYNIPTALHINGSLDREGLHKAFEKIIARHSALRTVFQGENEHAVQKIKALPVDFSFEVTDLSLTEDPRFRVGDDQTIDDVIQNIQPDLEKEASYTFDLSLDTLMRCHLWVIDERNAILLIVVHHIAADGWSMGVLTEELNQFYRECVDDKANTLAPITVQYVDYAAWQREQLSGENLRQQLEHWQGCLADLPSLHGLPLDRERPSQPSYQGQHLQTEISSSVAKAFKACCAEQGATLFMGIYGVLSVLIARYSGERDVVIGTTAANRDQHEIEGLIGFFVNMLVLRQKLPSDASFNDVLKESKRIALDAFTHQQTPFEKIVEHLNPSRDLSYHPLFQIMLAVQNNQVGDLSLDGLRFSDVGIAGKNAKFDLSLNVEEQDQGLLLDWEFSTDLFDTKTIERIAHSFSLLVAAMAESPSQAVFSATMLSDKEQYRAVEAFNDTFVELPSQSVASLFEAQVATSPDADAVTFGSQTLTYRALNQRANQLALELQTRGIGPDTLVGVYLERSMAMLVSLLAVLKSGGAYVPLDPNYPPERIQGMLHHSKPRLVLTNKELAGGLSSEVDFMLVDEMVQADIKYDANPLRRHSSSHDLAYVIYTSGSTGEPKGIAVENKSVVNFLQSMAQQPGIKEDDTLLAVTSISFDIHVLELYLPWLTGAHLIVASTPDTLSPERLSGLIVEHDVSLMQATPSTWQMLVNQGWRSSARLRMICGGEAMPEALKSALLSSDQHQLWNVYGPTETTVWSSAKELHTESRITLGTPIANTQFYVLNELRQLTPDGVPGELYIAGDGLARGYLHRDDLTNAAFLPNPYMPGERMYRTGDRVRRLENGELEYLGRFDHQVKIRGFRIELGAVDAALQSHDMVNQVISVAAKGKSNGDAQLISYVILNQVVCDEIASVKDASNLDTNAVLFQHVKTQLPHYMVPSAIVILDAFPLTPNGKVDRKALPQPSTQLLNDNYVAPETEIEHRLATLWAQVLDVNVESVSRHAHFFEIGGQSLKAIQLLGRMNQTFTVDAVMKDIFVYPVLRELALFIESRRESNCESKVLKHQEPLMIEAADRGRSLPLTHMQKRLWIIDQLEGGSCHYNMPLAFQWSGECDLIAVENALLALVNRHEILRTQFVTEENEAVQQVGERIERFPLSVSDLRSQSESEQQRLISMSRHNQAQQAFNLSQDLMIRAEVLTQHHNAHVLLLTLHHIAADGWSLDVLMKEFSELYFAFTKGQKNPLSPLALQYGDYALWQQGALQGETQQRLLSYWQGELEGLPVVHGLPLDRPRPKTQSYEGNVVESVIPRHLVQQLKMFCKQASVTTFMGLHAAFATLISRFSGEHDIVIGTPVANREQFEVSDLIGFFANTLVLRCDLSASPSFHALLAQCKDRALGAYEHQQMPFEQLVEVLQPERNPAHSPLFQIMLTFASETKSEAIDLLPVTSMTAGNENRVAKFDLTLHAVEEGDEITLGWEYATSIFDEATIYRLSESFIQLLVGLLSIPNRCVMELPLLTPTERSLLECEFNQTEVDYPKSATIHSLIEEQVAKNPDAPAVHFEGESLSYAELNQRANHLANQLIDRGVGPDSLVGVCCYRSLELVIGLLATLKAGGAYVPLDPDYPNERLAVMVSDAQPDVILTTKEVQNLLPAEVTTICLDTPDVGFDLMANPVLNELTSNHLAYVIYTSGSTGLPKGVMNEHQAVVNRILWMQQEFPLTSADKVLQKTPFSFDVSVWEFFWPLMTGAQLVVAKPDGHKDVDYLLDTIDKHAITTLHFVPPMLAAFMLDGQYQNRAQSVKRIFASGEALPAEIAKQWTQTHTAELHNLYGPTEAAIDVSWHACRADKDYTTVPIGKPINNIQLYVLNEAHQLAPLGVPGELYIGGDGVARGYLNREELTKERFIPNPFSDQPNACLYKTGDLARWNASGEVEYLGRLDHQVKIRGFRIELGEIDAQILAQPHVAEVITIDVEGQTSFDRQLVSYLVPTSSDVAPTLKEELLAALNQKLPHHMLPADLVFMEALPLTPNGKVNRRALPKSALTVGKETYEPPVSKTEHTLVGLWAEVLSLEENQISRQANFFDIGGQSLKAIQLLGLIRQNFNTSLTVKDLFSTSILSQLAQLIEAAEVTGEGGNEKAVHPSDRSGLLPLSHTQQRLWFIDKMEGASAHYNMSLSLCYQGRLEPSIVSSVLRTLIDRHEILRTAFLQRDGQGWQIIQPTPEQVGVTYTDVSDFEGIKQEEKIRTVASQESSIAFDLEKDLMIRAQVVHVSDNENLLLLTCHHIVADGWSLEIFTQEFTKLYEAYLSGSSNPLVPLSLQYGDYAVWQQQWLNSSLLQDKLDYWKSQLAGLPQIHSLPLDKPRPLTQSYQGSLFTSELSESLTAKLDSVCKQHSATMFMGLYAALSALLSRFSGEDDIVIGTPVANREQAEVADLIGFFSNTLVLRCDLSLSPSFNSLLEQCKTTALDAYQHQQVPFERLVEVIQPERSLSHHPLFQVMLSLTSQESGETDNNVSCFKAVDLSDPHNAIAKFDLTLHAIESDGKMVLGWEFCRDLFEESTIERMAGCFEQLLEAMIHSPDRNLFSLPMLDDHERRRLLVEYNQTQVIQPEQHSFLALFQAQAQRHPQRCAVTCDGQSLTYGELNHRVSQVAYALQKQGVETNSLVGVYLPRSIDMLVAMLAIGKAGGAYVPLDPRYPNERIGHMIEDARPQVTLTSFSLCEHLPEETQAVCMDKLPNTLDADGSSFKEAFPTIQAKDLAYVIYTSGSTGKPKGIAIEHGSLVNFLLSMQKKPGLQAEDTLLAVTSMSFDIHTLELFLPLISGAQIVMANSDDVMDPYALSHLHAQHNVTAMQATPATWQMLLNIGWQPPVSLTMMCGGEAMSPALKSGLLLSEQHTLWDMYGPTETCVWSAVRRLSLADEAAVIGGPIDNTEFYVLNAMMEPVPAGVAGELYIGGHGLARHYLHREDLTEKAFVPNPFDEKSSRLYRTGDQVRWLTPNTLAYMGRLDNQVKIRGFRVELGEIETVLLRDPQVSEAVTCIQHIGANAEPALVSYVVLADSDSAPDNHRAIKDSIQRGLQTHLPHYMVPAAIHILAALPLTPNGKIDRKALPQLTVESVGAAYVKPVTPTEMKLAQIWKNLLEYPDLISREANFFEIGGQSLLIVSLVTQIAQQMQVTLAVKDVFSAPTLTELALVIDGRTTNDIVNESVTNRVTFSEGARQSLYCFPGLGGMSIGFSALAQALAGEVNVHAFDAPGMLGKGETSDNFNAMVANYVEELKSQKSEQPLWLMGHSFGGRVALEVGRQLESAGISVNVFLLDVLLTNDVFAGEEVEDCESDVKSAFIAGLCDWLGISLPSEQAFDLTLATHEVRQRLSEMGFGVDQTFSMEDFWAVYQNQSLMNRSYEPQGEFHGRVTLLYCDELKPILEPVMADYQRWMTQPVTYQEVLGEHNSMLKAPYVASIAHAVKQTMSNHEIE